MSGTKFASGKYALGECDMCGFVFKLHQLIPEIYNQRPTGYLVCSTCWDEDNPQLQLGRFPINDPQALRNPRVDLNLPVSRNLWGWNPVGNPTSNLLQCKTGILIVNGIATNPLLDIAGTTY